jgi:uncharacterized coiled-coil protein SlyX
MSTKKGNAEESANGNGMSEIDVQSVLKQNQELAARLAELERKQAEKPRTFEEQLQFFNYQQQIISHLQTFQGKYDTIQGALTQVREKTENGDFDTKLFRLSLVSINGTQKNIFDISNPVVISKVLDSVGAEISAKIEALKGELSI